jgi:hypothetical protein
MEKHYCEGLGMTKSIYHTLVNGQLAARVVIRDRFTDDDLNEAYAEALRQFEVIRQNKENKRLRAIAIREWYRSGGGWRVRWLPFEHFANDPDKRIKSQVMNTDDNPTKPVS